MTEHKYTDEEVIRALEVCAVNTVSREGVFTYRGIPLRFLCADALDLINRQNEKITIQQKIIDDRAKEIFRYDSFIRDLHKQIETAKAEAINEFADRLKTYYRNLNSTVGAAVEYFIDQVVKEMTSSTPRVVHKDYFTPEKSENDE